MLESARFEMAKGFSIIKLWTTSFPHRLEFIM